MNTNIRFPQSPFIDANTGFPAIEWFMWLQSPQFLSLELGSALGVESGGTGLTSGTSGGVLAFTASTTLASSAELGINKLVFGGGAGGVPSTQLGLGTTTTLLHGNAAGAPTWGAVSLTADVSGILPLANGGTNAALTASVGGIFYSSATAGAILSGTATAGQILRSGASAAPTWSTATYPATAGTAANVLRSDGTNFLSAALAAADLSNGVTGSGAVVLANTPTLITPVLGVASATSINRVALTDPGINGATLALANNSFLATAGAWSVTLTATNTTGVTLPTTGTLATLAGSEELTNKTLTSSVAKGTWTASGTWTIPAVTLGGTVSGGGNQINNVIIGTSTPLAGSFTTLTASGLLDISASGAGQISFPATQNPSAGANVLDDYEEGTWTPTIRGSSTAGTQTYSANVGAYTKIGNNVAYSANIIMTAKGGTTAGTVQVAGFPFTAANTASLVHAGAVGNSNFDLDAGYTQLTCAVQPNTTTANVGEFGDNVGVSNLVAANLLATSQIAVSGRYNV